MPSRCRNNFLESERGLGHVTITIFGSTVGYPSDSLASCSMIHPSDRQTDIRTGDSIIRAIAYMLSRAKTYAYVMVYAAAHHISYWRHFANGRHRQSVNSQLLEWSKHNTNLAKHNYTEARLRVVWCQSARNKEVAGTNVQLDTRKSFQGRSTHPITLLLPYFDGTVNKNAVVKQYSYNTETPATKSPTEAMWVCWADFYNLSNSTGERLISNTQLTVTLALCCAGSVQKNVAKNLLCVQGPIQKNESGN